MNLSQRLILGCVLMACLTGGLLVLARHALADSGESVLGYIFFAAALLVANSRFGLLNRPMIPFVLRCVMTIAILDMLHYWIHRSYHRIPWLWRLHKVHHSDPDYDVSTALRFHPVESALSAAIQLGAIALLAPPVVAVLIGESMNVIINLSDHANASLPEGVDKALRFVFITPDIHCIHHSEDIRDQQLNMGVMFSWWDRLFGTYTPAASSGKAIFKTGLEGMENADTRSLSFMLAEPFVHMKQEGQEMRPDSLS